MFNSIYEVTFRLAPAAVEEVEDVDEDFDDVDSDTEEELVALIVCVELLSLVEFVNQLNANKVAILTDIGYEDAATAEISITRVEDVTLQQNLAMLPQAKTH